MSSERNDLVFSERNDFASTPPIRYRHDAPQGMRYAIIEAAHKQLSSYDKIRDLVCGTLHIAPDQNNWSFSNIRNEVRDIVGNAKWYKVYDIIEELFSSIEDGYGDDQAVEFARKVNQIFVDTGGGWQLVEDEGIVVIRGDADFEEAVKAAQSELSTTGYEVASKEIREALSDLSRRPKANLTGAIHHAIDALEATARYIAGNEEPLGKLASKIGLPSPLDEALDKIWGFSSNYGRHVSPTKIPSAEEAQLIVHLLSAYCRFLADRKKQGSPQQR